MAATEHSARAARALDDLYRCHAAEVYRYAYAVLGNHADAEDITQAAFVNALRALERGEKPRKPSNWLLTIAHNLIRQRFRQAQARPTEVALEMAVAGVSRDEDGTPSIDELVQALGRIPPAQREAIVMREFEGRSYAEISEILEITTGALETLLFRARRSLAEELENVVTCTRAEQDVSRMIDGRLTRRERRRLKEHLGTCSSCQRFEILQRKHRRALKGLALLPLPASLVLFKGTHTAAAAASIPTIGAASAVTTTTAATAGGGAASGGLLGGAALGGVAAKAAAVVAAVTVAGGAGYEGIKQVSGDSSSPKPAKSAPSQAAEHSQRPVAQTLPPGRARGELRSSAAHERAAARREARTKQIAKAQGRANAATRGNGSHAGFAGSSSKTTGSSNRSGTAAAAHATKTTSKLKQPKTTKRNVRSKAKKRTGSAKPSTHVKNVAATRAGTSVPATGTTDTTPGTTNNAQDSALKSTQDTGLPQSDLHAAPTAGGKH
jgi:RNA polymerase sigma-70 factor (ECF subfamily)